MPNIPLGKPLILPNGNVAPMSAGYRCDNLVFTSGQLAFDANGKLCTEDIATQTRLCLENIEKILKDTHLDRQNIVKVTVWLTDTADFGEFNQAYVEFFGNHRPARSTVKSDLMLPGAKVEIEAIAAGKND